DRDSQLLWQGEDDNWTNPSRFGNCLLSSETVGDGEPTPTPTPTSTPIPTAYTSVDIGTSHSGTTSEESGVITVTGSGARLWSDTDSFRYVYLGQLTGDQEIVAKVDSISPMSGSARVGIMIRQSTSANSNYQGIMVTSDG